MARSLFTLLVLAVGLSLSGCNTTMPIGIGGKGGNNGGDGIVNSPVTPHQPMHIERPNVSLQGLP